MLRQKRALHTLGDLATRSFSTLRRSSQARGALIITYTTLGVPYHNHSRMGNPELPLTPHRVYLVGTKCCLHVWLISIPDLGRVPARVGIMHDRRSSLIANNGEEDHARKNANIAEEQTILRWSPLWHFRIWSRHCGTFALSGPLFRKPAARSSVMRHGLGFRVLHQTLRYGVGAWPSASNEG